MRTLTTIFLVTFSGAALLALSASREPFALRLVRLEAAQAAPEMAHLLAGEPLAVSAAVALFADRPILRLNTHLALLRYPAMAREILPLYASETEFQDAFERFGPAVLLPIRYFMEHDVHSLLLMRAASEAVEGAKLAASRLLGTAGEDGVGVSRPHSANTWGVLTPVERGWYAVAFVREEGHDFLGQFAASDDERVEWIQTERITEAAAAFFGSGIRNLETKFRLDEDTTATDFLWASVDLTLTAGAAKVLRAGRAARGTAGAGSRSGARTTLAARTVFNGGNTALRVGRYGAPLAVAYAVLRHPSLISGLAAQAAVVLGLPVPMVQAAVWFIVLLPLLLVMRLLTRWLIRPVLSILVVATRGVLWTEPLARATTPKEEVRSDERVEPSLGNLLPPVEPEIEDLRTPRDPERGGFRGK